MPPTDDQYKSASEHLWKTYQVINEWIRFADAKAGALLTVNGVLIGAALNKLDGKQQFISRLPLHWLVLVLAIACGVCLILSAAYSLLCIKPTLVIKTGVSMPLKKSTIYFEHIGANDSLAVFRDGVLGIKDEKAAFQEISEQVYAVSKVATRKHIFINLSVVTLSVGLAFGVLLLAVLMWLTAVPGAGGTS